MLKVSIVAFAIGLALNGCGGGSSDQAPDGGGAGGQPAPAGTGGRGGSVGGGNAGSGGNAAGGNRADAGGRPADASDGRGSGNGGNGNGGNGNGGNGNGGGGNRSDGGTAANVPVCMGMTCTGNCGRGCRFSCRAGQTCTVTVQTGGTALCDRNSTCNLTIPSGERPVAVECDGANSKCDIKCEGACTYICEGGAACTVTCGMNAPTMTMNATPGRCM